MSRLKLTLFFGTINSENNEESLISLQIANSLAGLEFNIFTENKFTNLRILEFELNDNIEIELWVYYGSVVKDPIPAICLYEIKGIIVVGGESLPKGLVESSRQIIWFRQKTGSQLQKGMTISPNILTLVEYYCESRTSTILAQQFMLSNFSAITVKLANN
jgi:hypothetical protein